MPFDSQGFVDVPAPGKTKTSLPDLPSELITVALQDLRKVERSKLYVVHMPSWHAWNYMTDHKCEVCFAGAVMAKTLKAPVREMSSPEDFPEYTPKLHALDSFRWGNIDYGLNLLKLFTAAKTAAKRARVQWQANIDVVDYDDDPRLFKKQMTDLAAYFRSFGF